MKLLLRISKRIIEISIQDTASFLIASRVPNLLIVTFTQIATTYFLIGIDLSEILTIRFGLFIISTGMIGAGGYIINDYFDQKVDHD